MRIILVRHGITEWNKQRRFQGRTDSELSAEGTEQAVKVSRRLATVKSPEIIYTSPLKRAYNTAVEIGKPHKLTPVILPELEEINFGTWEGKSLGNLEAEMGEDFRRWKSDPFFNPPEGAETWPELEGRITFAVEVMKSSGCERVIAVTHGGIIRAIFAVVLGLSPHSVWNIEVFNCSISCIEFSGQNTVSLLYSNDSTHINGEGNLF